MVTRTENETMTRVGKGTPAGELLRRYWQPIAGVAELDEEPVLPIRLLGEDLVLYRDGRGQLGLLEAACAHRKVSLAYGIPEEEGLRCCYHGWLYDHEGRCLEQPAEAETSRFRHRVHQVAYPVEELGGLIFAYLGPPPAPLLPRFDVFAWEDTWRDVGKVLLPCNWLQCVENFIDLMHVDHLHGRYYDYVLERQGKPPRAKEERVFNGAKQVEMGFEVFEFGIMKRRRLLGSNDNRDWKEGSNPLIFPNMMKAPTRSFQIAVPVDDTHTRVWLYTYYRPDDGMPVPPQASVPVYDVPIHDERGQHTTDWVTGQDIMAWVMQGPIMDRATENLAASDQGIAFYRALLLREIEKVRVGEDPLGTVRDPERNDFIALRKNDEAGPVKSARFMDNHWQKFSPIFAEAKALLDRSHGTRTEDADVPASATR